MSVEGIKNLVNKYMIILLNRKLFHNLKNSIISWFAKNGFSGLIKNIANILLFGFIWILAVSLILLYFFWIYKCLLFWIDNPSVSVISILAIHFNGILFICIGLIGFILKSMYKMTILFLCILIYGMIKWLPFIVMNVPYLFFYLMTVFIWLNITIVFIAIGITFILWVLFLFQFPLYSVWILHYLLPWLGQFILRLRKQPEPNDYLLFKLMSPEFSTEAFLNKRFLIPKQKFYYKNIFNYGNDKGKMSKYSIKLKPSTDVWLRDIEKLTKFGELSEDEKYIIKYRHLKDIPKPVVEPVVDTRSDEERARDLEELDKEYRENMAKNLAILLGVDNYISAAEMQRREEEERLKAIEKDKTDKFNIWEAQAREKGLIKYGKDINVRDKNFKKPAKAKSGAWIDEKTGKFMRNKIGPNRFK
jgi:hypothetical protein